MVNENDASAAVIGQAAELLALSDGRLWDSRLVVQEILQHTEAMVCHAFEVGKRLLWAKAALPHGQFEPWCAQHLPFSHANANKYMRVAAWFLAHPELLKPLAGAGLKRTLLLTTLPDDSLRQLVADGGLAEASMEQIVDEPYVVLKERVEKLRKERDQALTMAAEVASECDDAKKRVVELERRVAVLGRALPPEPEKQLLDRVFRAHASFDAAMSAVGADLDIVSAAMADLGPGAKAQAQGLLAYMETRLQYERLRWSDIAGEDVTGAEYDAVLSRERPKAELYVIPAERVVPTFGGGE